MPIRWTKCFEELKNNSNVRMQQFWPVRRTTARTEWMFVAHVKRWLHDGTGPLASKSVSVVIAFS
jgi:hypothetical protein